jgi:hypothetical protein
MKRRAGATRAPRDQYQQAAWRKQHIEQLVTSKRQYRARTLWRHARRQHGAATGGALAASMMAADRAIAPRDNDARQLNNVHRLSAWRAHRAATSRRWQHKTAGISITRAREHHLSGARQ